MLSVASGEGRDRRAEPHDTIEAHKLLLCLAESLRFEPPGLSSLSATPATQKHKRAARTRRAHALAAAACCAAIERTTTHEGAAGVVLPRRHCALMDAIRSAAGAGAAGSVLRRGRRRRRRTDQPRRVHRSRQEGAALLAARQGRSHSPSLPLRTRAPAVPASAPRRVFAAALRRHRSPICTAAHWRMRAAAAQARVPRSSRRSTRR